jgi:hypothetical protein
MERCSLKKLGLGENQLFPQKAQESRPRPFAIIFVAVVEEKNGGLTCTFLKAKPEN